MNNLADSCSTFLVHFNLKNYQLWGQLFANKDVDI